jgi:hypothetical protein
MPHRIWAKKDVIFSKDYIFIGYFSKEETPFKGLISQDKYSPKQLLFHRIGFANPIL